VDYLLSASGAAALPISGLTRLYPVFCEKPGTKYRKESVNSQYKNLFFDIAFLYSVQ